MTRWPVITVLIFVAAAIMTAFLFHRWQMGKLEARIDGEESFASPVSVMDQLREIVRQSKRAQRKLASENWRENEALHCQCTLLNRESPLFRFEDQKKCGSSRNAVAPEIEKFPAIFHDTRIRASVDFPRLCVTYVMNKSVPHGTTVKPCVTESYVNLTYNLFGDVMTCMGIPQKEILPRIFATSGFHMNAEGPEGRAGIGQLLPARIEQVEQDFETFRSRIVQSDQAACKRLRPQLNAPPQEPLRSLLYTAIQVEQDRAAMSRATRKQNLKDWMQKAGFHSYEPEQLENLLLLLSSRTGPASAVLYVKNYLAWRAANRSGLRSLAGGSAMDEDGFRSYLISIGESEAALFLEKVTDSARELNSVFKEGTCVSESLFSL